MFSRSLSDVWMYREAPNALRLWRVQSAYDETRQVPDCGASKRMWSESVGCSHNTRTAHIYVDKVMDDDRIGLWCFWVMVSVDSCVEMYFIVITIKNYFH